jgi:tryptophan 2,3-dioxygenase
MVDVFRYDAAIHAELSALLHAPSLYDEYLRHLARRGLPVPARCTERDWSQPYARDPDLVAAFKIIYDDPEHWWDAYEMAEKLVDVEASFQLWRFRHLKTVERTIGHKPGTGGSSGVGFLKRALDHTFFPELIDVRTLLGAKAK